MGIPQLLIELRAKGLFLSLTAAGLRVSPRSAITPEARKLIQSNRDALIAALREEDRLGRDAEPLSERSQARRQRVIAMLAEQPNLRYAMVSDENDVNYPNWVVIAIGIRGEDAAIYTADLIIPRDSYDGIKVLDFLERHNGLPH